MNLDERRDMIEVFARLDCEEWHKHLSDYKFIYDRISESARDEYRRKAYDKWIEAQKATDNDQPNQAR